MQVWEIEHYIPTDQLENYHYINAECWCYPGEYKRTIIHRQANMIDRLGEEGKYISGYIWLNAHAHIGN